MRALGRIAAGVGVAAVVVVGVVVYSLGHEASKSRGGW